MSTAIAIASSAGSASVPAVWFGWSCPVCVLDSIPADTSAEAEYLAAVHDAMSHRGNPTTYLHTTTTTTTTGEAR